MIKAVLFDLDGVLVSAVEMHRVSFDKALMEVSGITLSDKEHEEYYNGLPTKKKLEKLISEGRVKDSDKEKIFQLKQYYTIESIPHVLQPTRAKEEMHQELSKRNIREVCVTNSIRETARLMLGETRQLRWMSFIISNEDVVMPKPHPEGYIRAMIRLRLQPEECLIVEDSLHGVEAAHLTGSHVLEVEGPHEVNWKTIEMCL